MRIAPSSNTLLQGTLDGLILKTLSWGPRHGYGVARWIRDVSDSALNIEDRALYLALHRLEERGWVEASWGLSDNNRKAKYYELTAAGRRELKAERERLTEYARAVIRVFDTKAWDTGV
jgi:PadR family transcriptional regulator PadR